MRITLTGAAGNITRPLAQKLLDAGHRVTIIGRSAVNLKILTDQGAQAAIGSLEDATFLTEAFGGADVVYTMIPAPFHATEWLAYHETVATNYVQAIRANAHTLRWTPFSDEAFRQRLTQMGFPGGLLESYLELGQGLADGSLNAHYLSLQTKPRLGDTKLETFANEFAAFYQQR